VEGDRTGVFVGWRGVVALVPEMGVGVDEDGESGWEKGKEKE